MGRTSKYDTDSIFVTGGESIYRMLLPYCDTAYITRLDYAYEADTWMPNLDKEEHWSMVEKGEERYCFDLIYHLQLIRMRDQHYINDNVDLMWDIHRYLNSTSK